MAALDAIGNTIGLGWCFTIYGGCDPTGFSSQDQWYEMEEREK